MKLGASETKQRLTAWLEKGNSSPFLAKSRHFFPENPAVGNDIIGSVLFRSWKRWSMVSDPGAGRVWYSWDTLPAGRRHQSPPPPRLDHSLPTLICPQQVFSQEILPNSFSSESAGTHLCPSSTSLLHPRACVRILLGPSDTQPWMPNGFLIKCSNFIN